MLKQNTEIVLLVMTFVPVLFHVKEMIFLYIYFKRMSIFGDDQNEWMNYFPEKTFLLWEMWKILADTEFFLEVYLRS